MGIHNRHRSRLWRWRTSTAPGSTMPSSSRKHEIPSGPVSVGARQLVCLRRAGGTGLRQNPPRHSSVEAHKPTPSHDACACKGALPELRRCARGVTGHRCRQRQPFLKRHGCDDFGPVSALAAKWSILTQFGNQQTPASLGPFRIS